MLGRLGEIIMPSALKNVLELKALVVLRGTGNSGKTTTLRMLLEEMFRDPNTNKIPVQLSSFFAKRKEFRIIVKYSNNYIYLSTYGDTLEDTQANISFFDGELDNNRLFFYQPGSAVKPLSKDINYLLEYTPSFCISASRSDGRVPFPLEYYGNKMRIHTSSLVWLHKEKEVNINLIHNANQQHAHELLDFIDRKLKKNLI